MAKTFDWIDFDRLRADCDESTVYLDAYVEDSIPPGDPRWLDRLGSLSERLAGSGGSWSVILPVGGIFEVPSLPIAMSELFETVEQPTMSPPAVTRMDSFDFVNPVWEGEIHEWRAPVSEGVLCCTSFVQWNDPNRYEKEPFDCSINWWILGR